MTQNISYQIQFSLSSLHNEQELMLPAFNTLLNALEKSDRTMAENLGLEMGYNRILNDLETSHFFYTISLFLHWPSQIPLDPWPDPDSLTSWMNRVRKDLLTTSEHLLTKEEIGHITGQWDLWAKEAGLTDRFAYIPISPDQISPIVCSLKHALDSLGGCKGVVINDRLLSSSEG